MTIRRRYEKGQKKVLEAKAGKRSFKKTAGEEMLKKLTVKLVRKHLVRVVSKSITSAPEV